MASIHDRYERLLEAGLVLAADLSLPATLQRIVELAADLTGARYGALGVLGRDGVITEFITTGVTAAERAAIGHIPVGRGILGVLSTTPGPCGCTTSPRTPLGRPAAAPPADADLPRRPRQGRRRVYGNLYLTEKDGGEDFDADDERALTLLAAQAGAAIEAANLYEQATDRAQRLEAIRAVSTAILAGTDTGELLGLIVRHARALVGAELATLALPGGRRPPGRRGGRRVAGRPAAGDGLPGPRLGGRRRRAHRRGGVLADAGADPRAAQPIVAAGVGPAVFIPLAVRGRVLGTLTVANGRGGPLVWPCSRTASGSPRSCTTGPSSPCSRSAWASRARPCWPATTTSAAASRTRSRSWTGSSATCATTSSASALASSPTASSTRPSRDWSRSSATCRVSLYRDQDGDGAVLEVDDDGRGFDPAEATGGGQGLRNLRERAGRLGGRAEIDSTPGQGTRARVTIPR